MREAEAARLYNGITNVRDEFIEEMQTVKLSKRRKPVWRRWGALAACACMLLGLGTAAIFALRIYNTEGSGPFGWNGDAAVFEVHREDFSPDISPEIKAGLGGDAEIKKAYRLRDNEWFLADNLMDFSQAVTTDIVYVVPGDRTGADKERSYSFYTEYDGMLHWGSSVRCAEGTPIPEQFYGLTYDMIEEALAEVEYEDYIITHSPRLYVVFVWARSPQGDAILTYPARPDLLGLENGGIYTLAELQAILHDKYEDGRRKYKKTEGGM